MKIAGGPASGLRPANLSLLPHIVTSDVSRKLTQIGSNFTVRLLLFLLLVDYITLLVALITLKIHTIQEKLRNVGLDDI